MQACRRVWHDIQLIHTSEQWIDLVGSYGKEMQNGWYAFKKIRMSHTHLKEW